MIKLSKQPRCWERLGRHGGQGCKSVCQMVGSDREDQNLDRITITSSSKELEKYSAGSKSTETSRGRRQLCTDQEVFALL